MKDPILVGTPESKVSLDDNFTNTEANFVDLYSQYATKWNSGTEYTSTNNIVVHGGNVFICSSDHTADSTTEPEVGASWETVWTMIGVQVLECVEGQIQQYIEGQWMCADIPTPSTPGSSIVVNEYEDTFSPPEIMKPGEFAIDKFLGAMHYRSETGIYTFTIDDYLDVPPIKVESYTLTSQSDPTSDTMTVDKPAGTVEDDLLILLCASAQPLSTAFNPGWIEIVVDGLAPGLVGMIHVVGPADPATYTYTFDGLNAQAQIALLRISGFSLDSLAYGYGPYDNSGANEFLFHPNVDVYTGGAAVLWFSTRTVTDDTLTLTSIDRGEIEFSSLGDGGVRPLHLGIEYFLPQGYGISGAVGTLSGTSDNNKLTGMIHIYPSTGGPEPF
jgi:hypothetical protein